MTGAFRALLIFLFALLIAPLAFALTGVVKTEGAMVYSKPDFDAEVLTTLAQGQKVVVSRGTTGSYAKFHRVRSGPVVGYIAEIDVTVEGAVKKNAPGKKSKTAKGGKTRKSVAKSQNASGEKSKARERENEERRRQERAALPFVFNKYVGVVVGSASYQETLSGVKKSERLLVYGLKATGPDLFFQGPILDLNVLLHFGTPKSYSDISKTKPSGFLILADSLLLLPVFQREQFLGTLGVGPLVTYRNFKTVDTQGFVSHSGFGFGLSLQAGAGVRLGDYALRLEGKYLLDKRVDTIFQLSLQNAF